MYAFRKVTIDWRLKAAAFNVFDRLPFGRNVYFQVQKHVTHTVPRLLSPTADTARWFLEHARVINEHCEAAGGLGGAALFEFGAGWDLYGNCVSWCLGAERQTVYDLTRWARAEQINIVLEHLKTDPPPGAVRVPTVLLPTVGPFEPTLLQAYGIDYVSPADAGATGRPDQSFDVAVTTSVLEHIPPAQILRLLRECHRVLPRGAVMSHVIDYSDHFAHSDPAITPYNYLSFDEARWQRYNPDIHYQNRLRHIDYRPLFEQAGFTIVSDYHSQPDDASDLLARVKLSSEFASRPTDELLPLVGHYVVQRV